MKVAFFNSLALLISLVFVKRVFARDEFFNKYTENVRTKLFEITDHKVPTFTVHLTDEEYDTFFLSFECEKDCSPSFIKRNDACYTAPWVNLTYSLERALNKNYIPRSKITDQTDLNLIDQVLNTHTHNITINEFEGLVTKYTDLKLEEIFATPYKLAIIPSTSFETTNASLTFDLDGKKTEISKIKFSVGGRSTKAYSKLGFNINIKKGLLYEAKQIRLRAEVVDPSFLREKLAYDLYNIIDLPTLSANFAKLYINNRFMGLYVMRDAFKSQWVENNFGEKGTTHLYACDKTYGTNPFFNCINDDDDVTDDKDWPRFLDQLANAKSRADLEKFFDVDTYIRWQVSRYLFGSWDHKTSTHNNVVYMFHNMYSGQDIWIPLLYDFDMNFGAYRLTNVTTLFSEEVVDPNNPLYTLLNLTDDSEEVRAVMDDILRRGLNPNITLPRIDELKEFIDEYVREDRTEDETGRFPGRLVRMSNKVEDHYQYEDFLGNTDFTSIKAKQYAGESTVMSSTTVLGMKHWIIERFKWACYAYDLDCSYADEILSRPEYANYTVTVNRREAHDSGCNGTSYSCCIFKDTPVLTTDNTGRWGIEGDKWCLMKEEAPTDCWSESQGYPCCEKTSTTVYYVNKKNGEEWGVEHGQWCGITDLQRCPKYSEKYACCKGCTVKYTDSTKWGIENNQWCSIPYSCDAN